MASIYDKASLVLIPSGTKTSKVYSQKPVNGDGDFTFSRSTAATRVNADGNIEKETQNFLLQSNSFNNSSWLKTGSPIFTSGQSDPFGGNDAWKFESSNAVSTQIYQSALFNTGSIYAKAGNVSSFSIWANLNVTFDLSSGTITSGAANGTIEGVGGGWYRCTIFNPTANVFNPNFIATAAGEFVYIAFSQAEQGLVARDYIETTTAAVEGGITNNVPRLDYTDSSCPALLLEPQRTNLVPHSEYINDASWGQNFSGGTLNVTSNYGISPDGSKNATRIEASITSGYADIVQVLGTSSGTAYTYSVYLKSLSGTPSIYFIYDGTANRLITLTTEWKRYTFEIPSAPTIVYPRFLIEYGLTSSSIDILAYGAQLEQGSYATSYIPTYGTSVTRNADTGLINAATDLIGQTEGTIFAEFANPAKATGGRYFSLSDGTAGNRIDVYAVSPTEIGIYAAKAYTPIVNTSFIVPANAPLKYAIAYKAGSWAWYFNGVQIGTNTNTNVPPLSEVLLTTDPAFGPLAEANPAVQALLFKTRLSNEELAALTTI